MLQVVCQSVQFAKCTANFTMVTVKFGLWSGLSQKFASCSCSQTAYFANCAD